LRSGHSRGPGDIRESGVRTKKERREQKERERGRERKRVGAAKEATTKDLRCVGVLA